MRKNKFFLPTRHLTLIQKEEKTFDIKLKKIHYENTFMHERKQFGAEIISILNFYIK